MTRTLLAVWFAATLGLSHVLVSGASAAQDAVEPLRIGGRIQAPKKIRDVAPVYPPAAQQARISGIVIIEAIINTDGTVRNARVIRSVPLLDQAAIDAVRQWEYEPTLFDGSPVPIIMSVVVNFSLGVRANGAGLAGPDGGLKPLSAPGTPVGAREPAAAASPREEPSRPQADKCLTADDTPDQSGRREAVIKFLEDVNAKQRTVFIARQGKGYAPRLDQLPGLPPLEGYDVQLVAADRVYSISVKEKTNVCGIAFFSDQTGSIYTAMRTR